LNWKGDTAYRLGGDAEEEFSTPWANWKIDRALVIFPQDDEYSEALVEEVSQDNAREVCQRLQGEYDFDGDISFVPNAYADHFCGFLGAMVQASVAGNETFEFEGESYPTSEYLSVGDAPMALYGRSTPEGLWILFMDSDETFDMACVLTALETYPGSNQDFVVVGTDNDLTTFDASKPWSYQHTHLMSEVASVQREGEQGDAIAFLEVALNTDSPAPARTSLPSP
jgi:hypothetical protein